MRDRIRAERAAESAPELRMLARALALRTAAAARPAAAADTASDDNGSARPDSIEAYLTERIGGSLERSAAFEKYCDGALEFFTVRATPRAPRPPRARSRRSFARALHPASS